MRTCTLTVGTRKWHYYFRSGENLHLKTAPSKLSTQYLGQSKRVFPESTDEAWSCWTVCYPDRGINQEWNNERFQTRGSPCYSSSREEEGEGRAEDWTERLWLKPYILCRNGRLAIWEAALSPWQGTERKVLNLKSPKQWEEQEASEDAGYVK